MVKRNELLNNNSINMRKNSKSAYVEQEQVNRQTDDLFIDINKVNLHELVEFFLNSQTEVYHKKLKG